MEELMNQIQPLIINSAVVVLTSIVSYVGIKVKKFFEEKADTETKKRIVKTTCQYVNQVYKDLDGDAKLEKAKENILEQLNEQGLQITDLELRVLIEATVNSFKKEVTSSEK